MNEIQASSLSSTPAVSPLGKGGAGVRASFEEALMQQNVKFSDHAKRRLTSDQVQLSPTDVGRIGEGMEKAAGKGAKEALLLLDNLALIANVRDRVVITSIDRQRLKENIFTKIDSAVIL